jgi:hypothetical protein
MGTLMVLRKSAFRHSSTCSDRDDECSIFSGKYDIQCGKAALDTPIMPISTCVRMKQAVSIASSFVIHRLMLVQVPRCLEGMRKNCEEQYDEMNCRAAVAFCSAEIETPYHARGPSSLNFLNHPY